MNTDDINHMFTYHAPTNEQIKLYEKIRDIAYHYAIFIHNHCPESREKHFAISNLENSVMWANAAIARHGHNRGQ